MKSENCKMTNRRAFPFAFVIFHCSFFISLAINASTSLAVSRTAAPQYDVVVIGGTPGGIAAAVTAARLGRTVALVEYHQHLGGMTTAGLGKTDVETPEAIGGLFREFIDRVYADYVERYGA